MTLSHLGPRPVLLLTGIYFITIICLFLYSFTQVDLSLTLSRISIWQGIQKAFQYIGYFNRPLSAMLYLLIVSILFVIYGGFLHLAVNKKILAKTLAVIVIFPAIILTFSYNAFSYDLFNYIFDAKIITLYGQNPYLHKALDFPGDPMLSFMHWTHRTYPYGPVWLVLTTPLSLLGMQFFIPTFFLFKALMTFCYLGTTYFISKILKILSPQNVIFGTIFFALNPLVIIESLVSAHNDIVMMFFSTWAVYYLIQKKYIWAFILLGMSIGIKFATVFILPIFIWKLITDKRGKSFPEDMLFISAITCMIIALVAASVRTIYEAWYFLYLLPLASLVARKYYILIPVIIISFFSLMRYTPFLYVGTWDSQVLTILISLTVASILLSIISVLVYKNYVVEKR